MHGCAVLECISLLYCPPQGLLVLTIEYIVSVVLQVHHHSGNMNSVCMSVSRIYIMFQLQDQLLIE